MKKIRDEQEFKRNPQDVILSRKPAKKRCEMLDSKIKLAVIITPSSKSHRYEYYYYANGGKHLKRLGDAQTMDYYSARRAAIEYGKNPNPTKEKNKTKTLVDVFAEVSSARSWQGETLRKRTNMYNSKFKGLAHKPIKNVTADDIRKIAARYTHGASVPHLTTFLGLLRRFLGIPRVRSTLRNLFSKAH